MNVSVGSWRTWSLAIGAVAVVAASVASAFVFDAQVVGSIAGVLETAIAILAIWPQIHHMVRKDADVRAVPGPARQSVAAPVGNAPAILRGRTVHLRRLRAALKHPAGRFIVLAGPGGVGKSALALDLHARATRRRARHTWWISARTPESFIEGLVAVAECLGADTPADADTIRSGDGRACDRLWERLSRARPGWLLVIDDADDVSVLGALDGTGWLRPSRQGLILLTSRIGARIWGGAADVIDVHPLDVRPAAQMLMDLADADAGTEAEARRIAQHLGGLPLALRVAGSDLGSPLSRWNSFAAYQRALESTDIADVLAADNGLGGPPDPRHVITTTFELSLTSLRAAGLPQATPLLRMLSCYAPSLPIPVGLLESEAVYRLLGNPPDGYDAFRHLHVTLRRLADVSLINEVRVEGGHTRMTAVSLHPVVSDTNRSHLRRNGHEATIRTPHQTAVEAIVTALKPLRADDSRVWPLAAILVPHVRQQLATSTAYLDEEHIAMLLDAAARLVAAAAWSGAAHISEQLAADALTRTAPLGDKHIMRLNLEVELAWAKGRNGQWDVARAELADLLDIWTSQAHPQQLNVVEVRHKLAWSIGQTGEWALAHSQLAAVAEQRRRILGDKHPDTLHTRCCLSWAMWRLGLRAEA